MKLAKQLFYLLCLTTLAPLVALWFWLGQAATDNEFAAVHSRHLLLARNTGAALKRYHDDLKGVFKVLAGNLANNIAVNGSMKLMRRLEIRQICIADPETGVVVHQISHDGSSCQNRISDTRLAQLEELAGDPVSPVSAVFSGRNGKPEFFIALKMDGFLAFGVVSTEYIVKLGRMVSFGNKGHAVIVDRKGNILAHPLQDLVMTRKNIARLQPVARMLKGETAVEQYFSPAMKMDMAAGLAAVKGTGWGVMVPQPVSELHEQARKARNSIFLVIILCIGATASLAMIAARMLSKPLHLLLRSTQELAGGKTDVHVDVSDNWHVPAEFKDLQERFNIMARAISRYQQEQAHKRHTAEAEKRHKMEYLANLGHELKTPLNSIAGFASVLKEAEPGALDAREQKEFLDHIEKSATHMLEFINDLVDLNRLELRVHKLQREDVHVLDAIRFCQASHRRQTEARGIEIKVFCPVRDLKLHTDERSFNQILINLVSNAIKYSDDNSRIDIGVRVSPGGEVIITIKDEGIGIHADQIEDVLLPFKRANDARIANVKGTGLGLSIVHKLTCLLEWQFSLESEYGFGTTARLIIPAAQVAGRNETGENAA